MASGSDRMLSVLEEYSQEELTQIEGEATAATAEQPLPVAEANFSDASFF